MLDGGAIAQWLPNGIVFQAGITFDDWLAEWNKADATQQAIQWVIGDILAYGENNFENWDQVIDPEFAEQHRQKLWVSKAIPLEQRWEGFSYSFHRELARLDREARDGWFRRAKAEGWKTVARLREERGKQPKGNNGGPPLDEPSPPASEADYGGILTVTTEDGTTVAAYEDGSVEINIPQEMPPPSAVPVPSGNRAEVLRKLIEDVREYGNAWQWDGDKAEAFYKRLDDAFGIDNCGSPLEEFASALKLKPNGWLATIVERDDGRWEVRLRSSGQKQAIALSAYLENALVEACLAAELSNGD